MTMRASISSVQQYFYLCRLRKLAASTRLIAMISTGLSASLLMANPVFASAIETTDASSKGQTLTCLIRGQNHVCRAQPAQAQAVESTSKAKAFEPMPSIENTVENAANTNAEEVSDSTARTALLSPRLDAMLSSSLLWLFYLSFPVSIIVAIWWHDRRSREQIAKLAQQVATLERIWQQPQTH
jgi:hypothetical protein